MEIKRIRDEELADVVGGLDRSNGKKKRPYCGSCATTLTFYCNVDESTTKLYCSTCKKLYLFNLATEILTDTGETVSF